MERKAPVIQNMSHKKLFCGISLCRQNKRIFILVLGNRVIKLGLALLSTLCLLTLTSDIFTDVIHSSHKICIDSARQRWRYLNVPGQIRTVRVKVDKEQVTKKRRVKTVLLWTTYFSEEFSADYYFFQKGKKTFHNFDCQIKDCYVTSDKSVLPQADAVLFHARDINFTNIPHRGRKDQIWILYCMEPPRYVLLRWNIIRSLFNWTMTYRSDSDIQVKYGEVLPYNDSCTTHISNVNAIRKQERAIWMVSNCRTESRRESYVRELKKYFPVDVYGKCSRRRKCYPPQSETCYRLLHKYKFYLSFENSICKDYVTEKFFNILQYDIVPVVFGGANYTQIAPPHSFIDATEFPDPKDLASYLEHIASNSTLYNSYLEWKKHYRVHLHPWMCDLCSRLHENVSDVQTLRGDLWSWWIPGSFCQRWTKKKTFESLFQSFRHL
ncbi:alpha-(1,3)-fucosyltransferase C-like [Uloborus diversus]|uniref:alpha-(1,3)-fucosyltransferase C-like n=1 Tax=Uloborus diversus TaxID=327109 RepID=UPI002409B781|nr:alpha-(1,3)-fucosyltransferase C-like [Uloborus diversus]